MSKEVNPKDILKYLKSSNKFLREIKSHVNKNLDSALTQETNKIIKKEYFPDDKIIRELYNEVFACYYCNLHNASLSVAMELLEYMSKKLYSIIFTTEYPKKAWGKVLATLIEHFESRQEIAAKGMMKTIDDYRKNVRNAQSHGNITQLVENNAVFDHNAINARTGERAILPFSYKKEIHGESHFFEAKDDIQNQGTNISIFLINAFIIHFFVLQTR